MTDTPNRTAGVKADLRMVGEDVAAALMLLTRIPVPWHRISDSPPDLNRALWAYPVVGLVISGLGAAGPCFERRRRLATKACYALPMQLLARQSKYGRYWNEVSNLARRASTTFRLLLSR